MSEALNPCPECSAAVGSLHVPGCDVERCPDCGCQVIGCRCLDNTVLLLRGSHVHPRLPWTGSWPGDDECDEFGWYVQFVAGKGWVPCSPDTPGAEPDLLRLYATATWDPEKARWVA